MHGCKWPINFTRTRTTAAAAAAAEATMVRLKIIGNDITKNVGKSESCMVYQLRMIFKRTRTVTPAWHDRASVAPSTHWGQPETDFYADSEFGIFAEIR